MQWQRQRSFESRATFRAAAVLAIGALFGCGEDRSLPLGTSQQGLTGIVAAWAFDQGTGTTAPDATGNAHTATLVGGVSWTSSGRYGGALSFDGVNDRVTVADANDLDLNSAWTVLAWVRPTSIGGDWRTVLLKEQGSALAYALYAADGQNQPPAAYAHLGTSDVFARAASALPLDTWTHLAASRSDDVLTLYRDGVSVGSINRTGSIAAATGVLSIGGNGVWGEWFSGLIDEVRVYGRALSVAEIKSEMATPIQTGGGGSGGAAGAGTGATSSGGRAGGGTGGAGGGGRPAGGAGAAGGGRAGSVATGGSGGTGSPTGVPLTIVPSETHQIVDGFGVSINSASWDNGELVPALDLLLDGGSTIFRVVAEMTDWESTNDNADAQSINWCSFAPVYASPRFDELWRTIEYLNQRGVDDRLVLSFMGRVPSWMGGADVSASMIDEWVETVASVAYYGRVTRGLRFGMFSPSNEIDWDGIEGPRMSAQTFATALRRLAQKLDTLGLSDLRMIGPETADINSGLGAYRQAMMAEPIVMQKLAAFALHNYVGSTGGARTILDGSAYPFERFWISELSLIEHVFLSVGGDASAVLVWDGYDSVYQHAILANRGTVPPNDAGNGPALLAYSTATHAYTPRRIYYDFAQLAKWVAPGSVRIGAREDLTDLEAFAFRSAATGRVTIVGRNSGSARTLSLSGLGGFSSLDHFRTSSSEKLTELADVVLTNGSASVSVPSGSVFTLTGLPNGSCP